MTVLRFILGDQLSRDLSALDGIDPATDIVLMAEVADEARGLALSKIGRAMAKEVERSWTRAKRGFEAKCALERDIERQRKAEKRQIGRAHV